MTHDQEETNLAFFPNKHVQSLRQTSSVGDGKEAPFNSWSGTKNVSVMHL